MSANTEAWGLIADCGKQLTADVRIRSLSVPASSSTIRKRREHKTSAQSARGFVDGVFTDPGNAASPPALQ
jgi:hypothetical protein